MNWTNSNLHKVVYNMIDGNTYTTKQRKLMRRFCSKQVNPTCVYCGGSYRKVYGCNIDDMTHMFPVCQLCHIVTQFVPIYSKMLTICESKMSQLDIVRTTVNFIHTKKIIPTVYDIDSKASIIKITPTQFFKTRSNNPTEYKIFYTKNIDVTNIIFGTIDVSRDFSNFVTEGSYAEHDIVSQRKVDTVCR
jgi:hypothetical protein